MMGIISLAAAILGAVVYWRLTRRDPLLTPDGAPVITWDAEERAETDIDIDPSLLPRVADAIQATVLSGFGDDKAATMIARCRSLDVDSEIDQTFEILWKKAVERLEVRVFRDDIESIILYFRGPRSMITVLIDQLEERIPS